MKQDLSVVLQASEFLWMPMKVANQAANAGYSGASRSLYLAQIIVCAVTIPFVFLAGFCLAVKYLSEGKFKKSLKEAGNLGLHGIGVPLAAAFGMILPLRVNRWIRKQPKKEIAESPRVASEPHAIIVFAESFSDIMYKTRDLIRN